MDALLVIDMQQAYFADRLQHDADAVIARINQVAAQIRQHQGKIIFIQHDGDGIETEAPFTPGWEIYQGLNVESEDIKIRKVLNDAFANSSLAEFLQSNNINRLIICGWATDFCVDTTIRSAVSQGFDVIVLEDCHTLLDRPHLTAKQIITHHNWVWSNLITGNNSIEVMPANFFLANCLP